jgi:multiple sugar transport system permease protein
VAPVVLTLAFLMLYPIGRVVYISLWENFLIVKQPAFAGLENFRWLAQQDAFPRVVSNTAVFTVASVGLHLGLGLGLAVLLSARIHPRLRALGRGLLIVPWLFTAAVVALTWNLMLNPFGIVNAILARVGLMRLDAPLNWLGEPDLALPGIILINLWRGYPFVMLMMLAALQSIPAELYEAAGVDGAGRWQQFRHVTVPSIRPIVASVCLLDAIWNVRLFDLVFLTTGGGPLNATHVMATYAYQLAFERFELGKASAMATLILVATSTLTLFYFRHQKV